MDLQVLFDHIICYSYLFEQDLTVVFLCMYGFFSYENLCKPVVLKVSILYLPSIK